MDIFPAYWSHGQSVANGIILLHLLGSLLTGVLLGWAPDTSRMVTELSATDGVMELHMTPSRI